MLTKTAITFLKTVPHLHITIPVMYVLVLPLLNMLIIFQMWLVVYCFPKKTLPGAIFEALLWIF